MPIYPVHMKPDNGIHALSKTYTLASLHLGEFAQSQQGHLIGAGPSDDAGDEGDVLLDIPSEALEALKALDDVESVSEPFVRTSSSASGDLQDGWSDYTGPLEPSPMH